MMIPGIVAQRAAVGSVSLLLDTYPGAIAAYSVSRKLRAAYAGSAIRVRRSSDNAQQDIGFSGNVLDEAALSAFAAGGSAFIATIYDQSGNGRDISQATTSKQPTIVSSGTIQKVNSRPMAAFDGSAHSMNSSALSLSSPSALAIFTALRNTMTTGSRVLVEYGPAVTTNSGSFALFAPRQPTSTVGYAVTINGGGSLSGKFGGAYTFPRTDVLGVALDVNQLDWQTEVVVRVNTGALVSPSSVDGTSASGAFGNYSLYLGARNNASLFYQGFFGELVVYPDASRMANTDVEQNLVAHFSAG